MYSTHARYILSNHIHIRLHTNTGRARVTLYFQRPGSDPIINTRPTPTSTNTNNNKGIYTVKLIVDGINHPYTAANYYILILSIYRKFYRPMFTWLFR